MLVRCASVAAAFVVLSCQARGNATQSQSSPLLFMSLADIVDFWGLIVPVANTVSQAPNLNPPQGENYTAGATVFGAFETVAGFEVFIAVGRAGEPFTPTSGPQFSPGDDAPGVYVHRYTTSNLKDWEGPTVVLFLADGWQPGTVTGTDDASQGGSSSPQVGDGLRWTVKSIARDAATNTYLMFASYQTFGYSFKSTTPSTAHSFVPTVKGSSGNFDDHDDVNVIYDEGRQQWVDMQAGQSQILTSRPVLSKWRKIWI